MTDTAISLTLDGTPDLPSAILQALYRITGRSTVELRRSIQGRQPLFTAALFGNAHIDVVPRLEKTIDYLTDLGLPFTLHEHVDGDRDEIDLATLHAILGGADGQFA
ncbi:hypothetical protein JVX92_11525 [Microbacterium hominis]|uniref:Uncharacterized protein n=1 Tax=Microbacterium hominis TaxID=162426 RepID=A0A134DJF7_9MICO|nr:MULTISPECIES: hypothetical protein [Microbacterium]AUG28603.1 hypothetical protein CXR34_03430 [Microbacterium hominis]KXC06680.1 hypothetical protein MhomT_04570 [Microbacterium hominis]QOC24425.1 hypothetical protein IC745_08400 [Microbacterium hominis]QOC28503.1 hypothetical protein IC744_14160 [Microbacterium hominis]QRY40125.1 hypothetical protein JVX92_11525 [Microbacterium hominis]